MNARLKKASLASICLLAISAQAQFLPNYSSWRDMSPGGKSAYMMALWDHATTVGTPDDKFFLANREGLYQCTRAMSLKSGMLSEAIDTFYKNDPKSWDQPVVGAFYQAIVYGICNTYITAERKKRGLPLVGAQ